MKTKTARDRFVAIRLTQVEHQSIKIRAAKAGVTMSEYVHNALNEFHRRSREQRSGDEDDLKPAA